MHGVLAGRGDYLAAGRKPYFANTERAAGLARYFTNSRAASGFMDECSTAAGYTMGWCVPAGASITTRTFDEIAASVEYTNPASALPVSTAPSTWRTSVASVILLFTVL